jgi:hypothetical protein
VIYYQNIEKVSYHCAKTAKDSVLDKNKSMQERWYWTKIKIKTHIDRNVNGLLVSKAASLATLPPSEENKCAS